MPRYEKLHIAKIFYRIFSAQTGTMVKETGIRFQVRSTLFGNCGHDHRTEEAAKPCLRRLQRKMHARRVLAARKAAVVRKVNNLLPTEVIKRKSLLPVEPIERRSLA